MSVGKLSFVGVSVWHPSSGAGLCRREARVAGVPGVSGKAKAVKGASATNASKPERRRPCGRSRIDMLRRIAFISPDRNSTSAPAGRQTNATQPTTGTSSRSPTGRT